MNNYDSILKEKKTIIEDNSPVKKHKYTKYIIIDLILVLLILIVSYVVYCQVILTGKNIFLHDMNVFSKIISPVFDGLNLEFMKEDYQVSGDFSIDQHHYHYQILRNNAILNGFLKDEMHDFSYYVNDNVSESGDGSEANPFKNLNSALTAASDGDTIYIAKGTYKSNDNIGLTISKEVTLKSKGGDVIFDGGNSKIFEITSSNVILDGLTFTNGGYGTVAAVQFTGTDNYAGGYVTGNQIINSKFINNNVLNSYSGAALSLVYCENVLVSNSTFINNFAKGGSAIYINGGTGINIKDSIFYNNTADANYGGIYFTSSAANVEVKNNAIIDTDIYSGLYSSTFGTFDYNWWGNTAKNYNEKPAIKAVYSSWAPQVNKWLFLNITSEEDEIMKGGSTNIKALLNKATDSEGNLEDYTGMSGLIINFTTTKGEIDSNATLNNGEAKSTFTSNEIANTVITASCFNKNITTSVNIIETGSFTELNNLIKNGGQITLEKNYQYNSELDSALMSGIPIIIDNTIINGNGFTVDGLNSARLFTVTGSNVTFKNLRLKNGKVNDAGGAIQLSYSNNAKIINCTFLDNEGTYGGAVIFEASSYNKIINSTFTNNKGNYGGAICYTGSSNYNTISNSKFEKNTGNNGGSIMYMGASTNNTVEKSIFISNEAKESNGGAISFAMVDENTIIGSVFVNNKAKNYGNGIFSMGINVIKDSILLNNNIYGFNDDPIVDYNWWGNTADNYTEIPDFNGKINNWVFLNN